MPSESQSTFKLLFFIGVFLFFGSLVAQPWVYVGQPIPVDSTWGRMNSQIESFPSFIGPSNAGQTEIISPSSDYCTGIGCGGFHPGTETNNANPTASIPGCLNGTLSYTDYWGCLTTNDEGISYVSISVANMTSSSNFYVNLSSPGISSNQLVLSISITIQCMQAAGSPEPLVLDLLHPTISPGHESLIYAGPNTILNACPYKQWGTFTTSEGVTNPGFILSNFSGISMNVGVNNAGSTVLVSYLSVMIIASNTQVCGGGLDGIGCNLSNFGWSVINFFVLLGSGLYFLFQVLFWFVSMIGVFFGSLTSIFGVQGAPPIVTGFFGIFSLAIIFYIAMVFFGKVRGTGNVG
jgi:hypothetical protein